MHFPWGMRWETIYIYIYISLRLQDGFWHQESRPMPWAALFGSCCFCRDPSSVVPWTVSCLSNSLAPRIATKDCDTKKNPLHNRRYPTSCRGSTTNLSVPCFCCCTRISLFSVRVGLLFQRLVRFGCFFWQHYLGEMSQFVAIMSNVHGFQDEMRDETQRVREMRCETVWDIQWGSGIKREGMKERLWAWEEKQTVTKPSCETDCARFFPSRRICSDWSRIMCTPQSVGNIQSKMLLVPPPFYSNKHHLLGGCKSCFSVSYFSHLCLLLP